MAHLVLIGIGGFIGAVLRYLISAQTQTWTRSASFPYGTLAVNLLGCLLIGILAYLVESRGALTPDQRLLLMTGLLGALTTFSTFGLETLNLLSAGQTAAALGNIAANNLLGLLAVWAGRSLPLYFGS